MAESIPCVKKFDPSGEPSVSVQNGTGGKRVSRLIYLAALGIVQEARKKALLLHCGGQELQEIFETFEEQFVAVDDVRPTVANCTTGEGGTWEPNENGSQVPPSPVVQFAGKHSL